MAKTRRTNGVAGTPDDPIVHYVELRLGDETYALAFDFNALAVAERSAGLNLMEALRSLADLSIAQIRGLLYAALLKARPDLTIVDAGNLITFQSLAAITTAISQALRNAMPDKQDENPTQPEAGAVAN